MLGPRGKHKGEIRFMESVLKNERQLLQRKREMVEEKVKKELKQRL